MSVNILENTYNIETEALILHDIALKNLPAEIGNLTILKKIIFVVFIILTFFSKYVFTKKIYLITCSYFV